MRKIKGFTSLIVFEGDCVIKSISKARLLKYNLLENEKRWLDIMSDFDRVSNVVELNKKKQYLKITNLGKRIFDYGVKNSTLPNYGIPQDWKGQVDYILKKLREYGCCHNDIKPNDILIKDNKINLVDFGWATEFGQKIPEDFPTMLGSKFKYKRNEFNDRWSFYKSMEYVIAKIKRKTC